MNIYIYIYIDTFIYIYVMYADVDIFILFLVPYTFIRVSMIMITVIFNNNIQNNISSHDDLQINFRDIYIYMQVFTCQVSSFTGFNL